MTLITGFHGESFRHFLTFHNTTVKNMISNEGISPEGMKLLEIYDIRTKGLDHQDTLWFINHISKKQKGILCVTLEESKLEIQFSYLITLKISFHSLEIVNTSKSYSSCHHIIYPLKQSNGKMYREIGCVIKSVIAPNTYVRALDNCDLTVSPLNDTKLATFKVRQYLGVTYDVIMEYQAFKDKSEVHVLIFSQQRSPNATFSPNKNTTVKYLSRGSDSDVFLSNSTMHVNDFLLHEEDPRFFYQTKIPGTAFTVFMSTSKPDYYLAVNEENRQLYLQNVPDFADFSAGYDNCKLNVYQVPMINSAEPQSLEPWGRLATTSNEMPTVGSMESLEVFRMNTTTLDSQVALTNDTVLVNTSNDQKQAFSLFLLFSNLMLTTR